MTNDNVVQLPAADESPAETLHWCRNGAHLIITRQDRCKPCLTQSNYRSIARNTGAKFCEEGHALVRKNVAEDGSCTECAAFAVLINDPASPVRPAPATWLDWAAVLQALNGTPLVRPLSTRELACVITTLQSRHPEWTWRETAEWMTASTYIEGVTDQYVKYVMQVWHQRNGYPDPRITLEQAVDAEADGQEWIRQAIEANRAAEAAELAEVG